MDHDGHVLLLDKQLVQVLEIAPDGTFVGMLGRKGQGPGEIENPAGLFLHDDGRLALYQSFPGKLVYLNRDGTPGGGMTAQDGFPVFYRVEQAGDNLVAPGSDPPDGGRSEGDPFPRALRRAGPAPAHLSDQGDAAPGPTRRSSTRPIAGRPYVWTLTADGSLLLNREARRLPHRTPGARRHPDRRHHPRLHPLPAQSRGSAEGERRHAHLAGRAGARTQEDRPGHRAGPARHPGHARRPHLG